MSDIPVIDIRAWRDGDSGAGDLMARWTGDRWRSTRHRVLPPSPEAPDEELISLILFLEADPDSVITTLPPPIGRAAYGPVTAGSYLVERANAATVTAAQ